MRKLARMAVVVGVFVAQVSLARAATEVRRLPANTVFATAIVTDPDTGAFTAVFVGRTVGEESAGGPPSLTIFFQTTLPNGEIVTGSGVLPQNAFHGSSTSASLDVDLNAIALDVTGELPANGVLSIDWATTDVQRTAGAVRQDLENGQVLFVGVRTEAPAEVTGTVFGTPLVGDDTNSNISVPRSAIIIITHD